MKKRRRTRVNVISIKKDHLIIFYSDLLTFPHFSERQFHLLARLNVALKVSSIVLDLCAEELGGGRERGVNKISGKVLGKGLARSLDNRG